MVRVRVNGAGIEASGVPWPELIEGSPQTDRETGEPFQPCFEMKSRTSGYTTFRQRLPLKMP